MEKIKKHLINGIKVLQLAKNEQDRYKILGKPIEWNKELEQLSASIVTLIGEIKNSAA